MEPKIENPFPVNALSFNQNDEYAYYFFAYFLVKAQYFQNLRTAITNAPKWKDFKQYTIPYYHFIFNDIDTGKFLKRYTYEEVFTLSMIASQYKDILNIPIDISSLLNPVDLQFIFLVTIIENVLSSEKHIMLASQYRQNGREYFATFEIPSQILRELPSGVGSSLFYNDVALITFSRNAPNILEFYKEKLNISNFFSLIN